MIILKEGQILYKLLDIKDMWVIVDHLLYLMPQEICLTALTVKKLSQLLQLHGELITWHERISYVFFKALQRLLMAVKGVRINRINAILSLPPCKIYRLANSHCQISCKLIITATTPFKIVYFDLIYIKEVFNRI